MNYIAIKLQIRTIYCATSKMEVCLGAIWLWVCTENSPGVMPPHLGVGEGSSCEAFVWRRLASTLP